MLPGRTARTGCGAKRDCVKEIEWVSSVVDVGGHFRSWLAHLTQLTEQKLKFPIPFSTVAKSLTVSATALAALTSANGTFAEAEKIVLLLELVVRIICGIILSVE